MQFLERTSPELLPLIQSLRTSIAVVTTLLPLLETELNDRVSVSVIIVSLHITTECV